MNFTLYNDNIERHVTFFWKDDFFPVFKLKTSKIFTAALIEGLYIINMCVFTYYSDKSHGKSKKKKHNMRSYKRALNCSNLQWQMINEKRYHHFPDSETKFEC